MRDTYYEPTAAEVEENIEWLRGARLAVEAEIVSALESRERRSRVEELREIERRVAGEMEAEAHLLESIQQA